ncbi:ribonuclease III [Candidatus Fermentibacteria bacterium]|nr:MAG: ribonuclease III [Candidatus Fermentibacteria bacterium]
MTGDPVPEAEEILKYRFNDRRLLQKALTHSSVTNSSSPGNDYERLEFLGDAVLELVTREYLLAEFPNEPEGVLTRRKIRIVQKGNLSEHGIRLGFDKLAHVGRSFVNSGGALESMTADIVESLIGAIYIDSGLQSAREFIIREILKQSDDSGPLSDARSELQEYCQAEGLELPEYSLTDRSGPDHNPVFTFTVSIEGKYAGRGTGPTRRAACGKAARIALKKLERMV